MRAASIHSLGPLGCLLILFYEYVFSFQKNKSEATMLNRNRAEGWLVTFPHGWMNGKNFGLIDPQFDFLSIWQFRPFPIIFLYQMLCF